MGQGGVREAGTVAVGVLTYRRPDGLRALLTHVLPQLDEAAALLVAPAQTRVIVVDNDPGGSGREVIERFGDDRIHYGAEPEPGLSAARNKVLALAQDVDLLVFIDDDETPEPGWLTALIQTWQTSGADGVSGPVVSLPDGALHPWVAAGGFFERSHRHHLATGDSIARAATNNLLVDLRRVRELDVSFDRRFALSGGEDSMFTGSLVAAGARLVWCEQARVLDHLPAARLTPAYAIRRTFNLANGAARVEMALAPTAVARGRVWLRTVAAGLVRLALGVTRFAWGCLTRSQAHRARAVRAVTRGRGELSAAVGVRTTHYGTAAADHAR